MDFKSILRTFLKIILPFFSLRLFTPLVFVSENGYH